MQYSNKFTTEIPQQAQTAAAPLLESDAMPGNSWLCGDPINPAFSKHLE